MANITKGLVLDYNEHKKVYLNDLNDYLEGIIGKDELNASKALFDAYRNGESKEDIKALEYKRTKLSRIKSYYDAMSFYAVASFRRIFWFTLTWDNESRAKRKEKDLLRQAQRFLDGLSDTYLIVSEYGEKNGNFHLHGYLVGNDDTFSGFIKWPFRQNIVDITPKGNKSDFKSRRRYTNYICSYISKESPRIRPTKHLSRINEVFKSTKRLQKRGGWCLDDKDNFERWFFQALGEEPLPF